MSRKIRYGMVGGGRGAFIGAVHRIAAAMDQQIELVCGAFSSDPERSRASGADLFLPAGKRIVLDGDGTGPVNNVAVMSAVAPSYAPPGRALIAASCVGLDVDEDAVEAPTDRMAQVDTTTSRARITAALAVETGLNKWIAPAVLTIVAPTDLADLARNPTNHAAPKS